MSDRAYTRIDGRKYYVGNWNSPESFRVYARLLGELAGGAVVTAKIWAFDL